MGGRWSIGAPTNVSVANYETSGSDLTLASDLRIFTIFSVSSLLGFCKFFRFGGGFLGLELKIGPYRLIFGFRF